MKKILFATLALAVMFTSCSKEDNGGNETQENVLLVKLPDNVSLRAVETQGSAASTITLNDVTVFLLNGNNVVGAPKTFTGGRAYAPWRRRTLPLYAAQLLPGTAECYLYKSVLRK